MKMTQTQKALLIQLGDVFEKISQECANDETFHGILIDHNDLYNISLDELSSEWHAVAYGQREIVNNPMGGTWHQTDAEAEIFDNADLDTQMDMLNEAQRTGKVK